MSVTIGGFTISECNSAVLRKLQELVKDMNQLKPRVVGTFRWYMIPRDLHIGSQKSDMECNTN
jgi:hypothetical protein